MTDFRDQFLAIIGVIVTIILVINLLNIMSNPDPSKVEEIIADQAIPVWIDPIIWISNHFTGIIGAILIIVVLWLFKEIKF